MFDEQKPKIEFNLVTIGFVILEVIFLIIAGVLIVNLLSQKDEVADEVVNEQVMINVSNLSELSPRLNQYSTKEIQEDLLLAVQSNSNLLKRSYTATIRKDSIISHHIRLSDSDVVSAIIDIPDLEQSYHLFYEFSDDTNQSDVEAAEPIFFHYAHVVTCLTDNDETIYPDFKCDNALDNGSFYLVMQRIVDDFMTDDYGLMVDEDDPSLILIFTEKNVAGEEADKVIEDVKNKVVGYGLPNDIFKYQIAGPDDMTFINN